MSVYVDFTRLGLEIIFTIRSALTSDRSQNALDKTGICDIQIVGRCEEAQ